MIAIVGLAYLLMARPTRARADGPDFAQIFAGRDACFELYDMTAKQRVIRSGGPHCATRVSPCSTFKLPLALMAFDSGVLIDANSAMTWDGKDYGRDVWNRDQTAATWIRDSVVWFSQRLTPRLGPKRIARYLRSFEFGNQDFSGGLTRAWLDSSLKISPDEQLRFLVRLFGGELAVSKHALETTRALTMVDTSEAGWTLFGKTGSGSATASERDRPHGRRHGWFVGQVVREGQAYVFATEYVDRKAPADDRPAGFIARELTKMILTTLGMY